MVSFIESEASEYLPEISEHEIYKTQPDKNRVSMPLLKFEDMKKYRKMRRSSLGEVDSLFSSENVASRTKFGFGRYMSIDEKMSHLGKTYRFEPKKSKATEVDKPKKPNRIFIGDLKQSQFKIQDRRNSPLKK